MLLVVVAIAAPTAVPLAIARALLRQPPPRAVALSEIRSLVLPPIPLPEGHREGGAVWSHQFIHRHLGVYLRFPAKHTESYVAELERQGYTVTRLKRPGLPCDLMGGYRTSSECALLPPGREWPSPLEISVAAEGYGMEGGRVDFACIYLVRVPHSNLMDLYAGVFCD